MADGRQQDHPQTGEPWCRGLPPELMDTVVDDLRRMAAATLGGQARKHTLQPTAIVNEVWLRMANGTQRAFPSPEAFFAFSAKVIRTILVDHARKKLAVKRGGRAVRRSLDFASGQFDVSESDMLDLEDELVLLESINPVAAQILEMRFYAGMTDQQIAGRLGVTARTVRRYALHARLYFAAQESEGQCRDDDGGSI